MNSYSYFFIPLYFIKIYGMKNLALFIVVTLAMLTACDGQKKSQEEQINDCATGFAEAYFNYDFQQAERFVTPESSRWLKFAASNIGEADVKQLNEHGEEALVEVMDYSETDDSTVVVTVEVDNYLRFDSIGGRGTLTEDSEYQLTLVNRNGNWLVRMAGLPRSEKRNLD